MKPFVVQRLLRFGDCDPLGIAYSPSYLNLLNGVVEDFWNVMGFPMTQLVKMRNMGVPTVQLVCQFKRAAMFGEKLTVILQVLQVGRSSLHFSHMVSGADGVKCSARQVVVATSLREQRAIPWPDDIRDSLRQNLTTENYAPT